MRAAHEFSRFWLGLWAVLICVVLLAPLVFVVAVSLTPLDYISLPTTSFSLRWYRQMLEHQEFLDAGLNSILLAVEASVTALAIGVLAALAAVRYRFRLRQTLLLAISAPLFVPMVMSGLAILMLSSTLGIQNQSLRLYVGHAALTIPYVFRTVSASLSGFDINQELAARNLGAGITRTFWEVTMPQIGPGILAGALFAFIVSFDNIGISIFLTGAKFDTLPVELYTYAAYSNDPMSAAVSVAMMGLSIISIVLVERLFGLQKLMLT